MGLERLAALVAGEDSNYHTELFLPLIERVAGLCQKDYCKSASDDDISMRVVADHARASAFLIGDGVQPSNEGRGYVLRRIMRRAIRHGKRLGLDEPFFHHITQTVVTLMGATYPELSESAQFMSKVVELEEQSFRRTLDTGLGLLSQELDAAQSHKQDELAGDVVFKLYDTYGFPKDLTEVLCAERGIAIDNAGFEREMAQQKERSRGGDTPWRRPQLHRLPP
jgi:alanyl-tRNA synthetase